jgi:hypothetical protein
MNDTLVSRRDNLELKREIASHLETKIAEFKAKLAVTPKFFALHNSIEKIITADEARLMKMKAWINEQPVNTLEK